MFLFDVILCRLVGKVAAENGHKWIYSDTQNGHESNYVSPWNASIDHVMNFLFCCNILNVLISFSFYNYVF
jgi:hypothetical protein